MVLKLIDSNGNVMLKWEHHTIIEDDLRRFVESSLDDSGQVPTGVLQDNDGKELLVYKFEQQVVDVSSEEAQVEEEKSGFFNWVTNIFK